MPPSRLFAGAAIPGLVSETIVAQTMDARGSGASRAKLVDSCYPGLSVQWGHTQQTYTDGLGRVCSGRADAFYAPDVNALAPLT